MAESSENYKHSGMACYVEQHAKCPVCSEFIQLVRRAGNGSFILMCPSCGKVAALETTLVDDFIRESQTHCPTCGAHLVAKSGKHGVFVKCEIGHFFRVVDV